MCRRGKLLQQFSKFTMIMAYRTMVSKIPQHLGYSTSPNLVHKVVISSNLQIFCISFVSLLDVTDEL